MTPMFKNNVLYTQIEFKNIIINLLNWELKKKEYSISTVKINIFFKSEVATTFCKRERVN